VQIFVYTVLFVVSTLLLTPLGYTGWIYFAVMALAGGRWLLLGWQGLTTKDSEAWARRMFHFSLIILMLLSTMLAIGPLLP
jgi:protoheme IX farnesyltransferase